MAIVTLQQVRDHIGLTEFNGAEMLTQDKADAAQNHIERMLGYRIESRFGGEGQEPVPEALKEAVLQLAAWWFDNREAVTDAARILPFGVSDIVAAYRDWTF